MIPTSRSLSLLLGPCVLLGLGSIANAQQPGTRPEPRPRTRPADRPAASPDARPDARPEAQPGVQPGTQPGARPGAQPGTESAPPPPRRRPPRRVAPPKKKEMFKPGSGMHVAPGAGGPSGIIPMVRTSFGSAKMLTLLQARLNVPLRGAQENWQAYRGHYTPGGMNTEQNIAFRADRIRLILTGHFLTKNLEYMFQGDAVQRPFFLDVKFTYHLPWVKGLSVTFGRFLSVYSLIMSRLISRLETTEYPIFMSEGGYAPWRDFGLQIKYALGIGKLGTLNAYFGVFNGETNSWTDTNDMKDFLFRVDFMGKGAFKGLWVGAYAWLGFPSCTADVTCVPDEAKQGKFDTDVRAGLFAEWQKSYGLLRPHAMVEGYLRSYTPRASDGAEVFDMFGGGLWAHAGVRIGRYVEPMLRAEYMSTSHQQNTQDAWDIDGDGVPDHSVANDWAMRLTAGVQVYFNQIHSHLKINYIYEYMGRGYGVLGRLSGNGRFGGPAWTETEFRRDTNPAAQPGSLLLDATRRKDSVHMFVIQAVTEF